MCKKRCVIVLLLILSIAISSYVFATQLTFSSSDLGAISLTPINKTHFVIVWCDGTDNYVYMATYNVNSTVETSATKLGYAGDCSAGSSKSVGVSALSNTEVAVVYYGRSGAGNITSMVVNVGGATVGGSQIIIDSTPGSWTYAVDVAALNSTDYVVLWDDDGSDDYKIVIANRDGTTKVAGTIIYDNPSAPNTASITALDENTWVAGITDVDTDLNQSFIIGNSAGSVLKTVTVDDSGHALSKSVTVSALNSTVFGYAWHDATSIYAKLRFYDVNGNAVSSEKNVDTTVTQGDVVTLCAINSTNVIYAWDNGNTLSVQQFDSYLATSTTLTNLGSGQTFMDCASEEPATGIQICNDNFVVASYVSATNSTWYAKKPDGSDWDGICLTYSPIVTTPSITPTIAYTTSNLTTSTTYSDVDSHTGNITFRWYVNGSNVYNQSFNDQVNGTVLNSTLGSGNYSHFNLINVSVQATDSSGKNSSVVWSSQLNISNTIPTIASAVITPDPAVDTSNLTCGNGSVADIDGDTVTLEYTWYNNSVITPLTNQIVGLGNTTVGEQWYCKINVTDSYNYSGAVTSQTVVIGSSLTAPTINYTNATTTLTSITSDATNPTANNSWVNLSVTFNDANSGENHTAHFCKTNVFDGTTCTGGEYCKSTINSTLYPTLTCRYNVSSETTTTISYYTYVVDNETLFQGSGSGTQGSITINYPPTGETISAPNNDTWTNSNSTLIQFSATDPDSDSLTYYVYADNTTTPTSLVNTTTSTSFNWTSLNQTYYYIRIKVNDSHGYESSYSNIVLVKVDLTNPTISGQSISDPTITISDTETFTLNCTDDYSNVSTTSVSYDIVTSINSTTNEAMTLSSGNTYTDTYTPLGTVGTYNITYAYCTDNAGNTKNQSIGLTFTTTADTVPSGSSGGGGNGVIPDPIIIREGNFSIETDVGSGSYELFITRASCRKKTVIIKNQADIPIDVIIYCESTDYDIGNICEFVTIDKNNATIPANIEYEEIVSVEACLPDSDSVNYNESYFFNIVVERTDISPSKRGTLGFKLMVRKWTGLFFDLIDKFKQSWALDVSNIKPDADPINLNKSFAIVGAPLIYLFMAYFVVKNREEPLKSTVLIIGTIVLFVMVLMMV